GYWIAGSSPAMTRERVAAMIVSLTDGNRVTGTMRRAFMIAILSLVASLVATPASAELRIPCLWNPFGGCSFKFVSPEYAAKPVQPLDPQAALAAINEFRAEKGLKPLVLDDRLSRAATMQSEAQAGRSWIGHSGSDGSTPKARALRAGYHAKIASENVASGQKSFGDVLSFWKQSSGHRTNLLRPNVTAIGVAMAKTKSGRPYWTLVLGAE
ncbi:MAG TPA: CAP domain-containing protein, partial [Hyphomicrobium sp.]